MRGLVLAAAAGLALAAGTARAETTLKLTEVITSPQRTEMLKGLLAKFEQANPGVKVEVTSLPWGQAFEKLATMVQGGNVPDVVEMPDRWLALYASGGQLESLKPWMDKWDNTGKLTDRAIQFGSWYKNIPYEIPYGFYIRAMFWNKKMFQAAGLSQPPATVDEFVEDSKKIAASGQGKYGYCLRGGPGATNGYIMSMLTQLSSNEFFDQQGNSTLDRPEAVKGLQVLVDMYQKGYVPKDSVNWGFNEIVAGFYSGTCAMLDQDPDALIAVAERMKPDDFAVAPMPLGPADKAFPTLGYGGWAMFSASKHKDDDWKLISFLSSPESNLEWAKFVGVIPIYKGAERDPHFATEQYKGWFTELNDPRWQLTSMPTYLEEFGFFADQISIQGGQEALLGRRSAKDVADEWAKFLTDAQKKWLTSH